MDISTQYLMYELIREMSGVTGSHLAIFAPIIVGVI